MYILKAISFIIHEDFNKDASSTCCSTKQSHPDHSKHVDLMTWSVVLVPHWTKSSFVTHRQKCNRHTVGSVDETGSETPSWLTAQI